MLRRRYLGALTTSAVGLVAGCQTASDESSTPSETTSTRTASPTPPSTGGPSAEQVAKLSPAGGDENDVFGESVSLSGDGTTVLVGAVGTDTATSPLAGSAYLFSTGGDGWRQQTQLVAEEGGRRDRFGAAVSLARDGGTALVGAQGDTTENGEQTGAAVVFRESGGTWDREARLTPTGSDAEDRFGSGVAIDATGETALVGAYGETDPNGANAGAAYVFGDAGDAWTQRAKFTPEDGDRSDFLGWSVALADDGTRALVGAPGKADDGSKSVGAAYVYELREGDWTRQAKLTADDGDKQDFFGRSVALSSDGSVALLGAENDEDPNGSGDVTGTGAGSAYVFERADGSWIQRAKLAADDGDPGDQFGSGVALGADGRTAVVGAQSDEDPNGGVDGEPTSGAGSTYVFSAAEDGWTQTTKLAADDGDSRDRFGRSVAIDRGGSTVCVGAQSDEDPNGSEGGSAYVFEW